MRNNRRRQAVRSAARRNRREFDKRKFIRETGRFLVAFLITIVFAYSLVTFGWQTVTIAGDSMNPSFCNGDTVIVHKMTYRLHAIERFDVVAYKYRDSEGYYDVKRIIGLPGEKVTILNGKIYINDTPLSDVPFDDYILSPGLCEEGVTLNDGEYFVIGDNVNNSEDSRFVNAGNVMSAEILGKVTLFKRASKK